MRDKKAMGYTAAAPLIHDQTPIHHCKALSGCLAGADHHQALQKMAASFSQYISQCHRKNTQPILLHTSTHEIKT